MVSFKSWRDFYLFLQKYHNFSCLQCKHYNRDLDTDKQHSDFEYSHFFCPQTVSIIDFAFQVCCPKWTDTTGKSLKDYEESPVYNFSDEIIEKLDLMDKVSIEEIDEIINKE